MKKYLKKFILMQIADCTTARILHKTFYLHTFCNSFVKFSKQPLQNYSRWILLRSATERIFSLT